MNVGQASIMIFYSVDKDVRFQTIHAIHCSNKTIQNIVIVFKYYTCNK